MKKSVIIIIGLAVAIVLTAIVLVVSLVGPKVKDFLFPEKTTYDYIYSMPPTTTNPVIPANTDSWIDINSIAGDLATATDTNTDTSSTSLTLAPIVIGSEGANTTIIYIDQNGNIVDPNDINKTTTHIDNDIAFDDTVATTNENNSFSEYEVNSAGILTNYFGNSKTVIIPGNLGIKGIGANCFKSRQITMVSIPASVKVIESGAFMDCKNLERVVFAEQKVTVEIGNSAFKGCTKLSSINLPITSKIGMSAFESCKSLKELDIKKGTKEIGQYCFAFCESLTSLTIRDDKTVFSGITTFKDHNANLIVYCEVDSDVEMIMKGYGLNTAPISG